MWNRRGNAWKVDLKIRRTLQWDVSVSGVLGLRVTRLEALGQGQGSL